MRQEPGAYHTEGVFLLDSQVGNAFWMSPQMRPRTSIHPSWHTLSASIALTKRWHYSWHVTSKMGTSQAVRDAPRTALGRGDAPDDSELQPSKRAAANLDWQWSWRRRRAPRVEERHIPGVILVMTRRVSPSGTARR